MRRRAESEADAGPTVVGEVGADPAELVPDANPVAPQLVGRADAAAQQDRGRPVRAGGQDDAAARDGPLTAVRAHQRACGAPGTIQDHAIDQRVAEHAEVRTLPRTVQVRERGVVPRTVDHVRGHQSGADALEVEVRQVREARGQRRVEHGRMPRAGVRPVGPARSQRRACTVQARLERPPRPRRPTGRAPALVLRGGAPGHRARIVCRAPAEHAGPRQAVTRVAPVVAVRNRRRVEQLLRPPAGGARPIVRAGLHEAHGTAGVLAEPGGQDATRRSSPEDDRVERPQLEAHATRAAPRRADAVAAPVRSGAR
jgi:hypothetical protein